MDSKRKNRWPRLLYLLVAVCRLLRSICSLKSYCFRRCRSNSTDIPTGLTSAFRTKNFELPLLAVVAIYGTLRPLR